MQVIKKVLIILYTLFLGFIVFCNTSVFADEVSIQTNQLTPNYVSNAFDDYIFNMQDEFDYNLFYQPRSGYQQMLEIMNSRFEDPNYLYYVEKGNTGYGTGGQQAGYIIWFYNSAQASQQVTLNTDFKFAQYTDINGWSQYNDAFNYPVVTINSYFKYVIYNWGQSFAVVNNGVTEAVNIPFCAVNYTHPVYHNFYIESTTNKGSQVVNSINNQTNTIKNESAKVTSAINNQTQATKEQTNQFLDTNNTGNDTLEVNANVEDKSVNLDNFFMSIYNAFTSASGVITKKLTLTLPNNSNFDVNVRSDMLSNFFENNTTFKVFYQAFWWVALGGYVIFDVKRMYNLVMIGKWDVLHLIDKPTDVVVDLSTGSHGKGGSIY